MFLYETHLHTTPASACAHNSGGEYAKWYHDSGYSGIIVTDHFFRGNCAIDRQLPWREWVHRFCIGYEDAKNEGDRLGLPVFFGWEETINGDDYLVYGLDKEWLLEHPEVRTWNRRTQFEEVSKNGGCVVQAHPFRERPYIKNINLNRDVHAIEVYNAANRPIENKAAEKYAALLHFHTVAGSDAHSVEYMSEHGASGVYLDTRIASIHDYVAIVTSGKSVQPKRLSGGEDALALDVFTTPLRFWGDFTAGEIEEISKIVGKTNA
jgi:hypothetical protein